MPPFRIPPALPVTAMKTYRIASPWATHWRPVTCEEAGCAYWSGGWATVIDEATDLGGRQAHYIRRESGRRFTEERDEAGLTRFRFEAGQKCFAEHQARNEASERFIVVGGDFRGNPSGERRVHSGPDPWLDDFQTHQDRLKRAVEGG